jgi:hypothetical protein
MEPNPNLELGLKVFELKKNVKTKMMEPNGF